MSLTKVTYSMIVGAYTNVKDFGATGDGTTNDTVAIQAAIDSLTATGGVLYFPFGTYKIARTVGANDHWGLKVTGSNITIIGDGASLSRFNTDISTYALAYPLLFIGTPDNNAAAATQNVKVTGITFVGNNVQHNISGSSPNDFRCAIYMKNTKNTVVQDCVFTNIDSSVVFYQQPVSFDYTNSVYYNTTKNYNSRITNCQFLAVSHSTFGRALVHAIEAAGIDYLSIENNYFEWCDDCFSAETTYNIASDVETDTYTPSVSGWTLGAVKRSGRGHTIVGNTMFNSSEHCVYASSMDVVVSGNNCRIEDPAICLGDVKINAKYAAVTGNTIVARIICIQVSEPAFDVAVTGNTLTPILEGEGGAVAIQSVNLVSYIANRIDYLTYIPMQNITISANTIDFPPSPASSNLNAVGVRLYSSDVTNINFPNGTLLSTTISNNVINNHTIGIYLVGSLVNIKYVNVIGNTFYGKSYAGSFGPSAVMNTYATIAVSAGDTEVMASINFTSNIVTITRYLVATDTGGGTSVFGPNQIQTNELRYVQNYGSTDMRSPTNDLTQFSNNNGYFFLDRTGWLGDSSLNNALGDLTSTANSFRLYRIQYDGTNVKFFTNDTGTAITLG
jgi:hypothetical protein